MPATRPTDDEHPLRGAYRPAAPYRWGGHVSPQFVFVCLVVHAVALGIVCSDWDRIRLMLYDFEQAPTEEWINRSPEELTRLWGYEEDAVEDLASFRAVAAPLVAGVTDAPQRARRLADHIYSLRAPAPTGVDMTFLEDVRVGPARLLALMEEGRHANCGQMSTVLATFWRSLGSHTRAVRWGTADGHIGHYAVELWDAERRRWFYYDMNANGYAVDDDGVTPLSVASLRPNLLTAEDLHLLANTDVHDYTQQQLVEMVREYPVEWYVLNNAYLAWSPERRFGWMNPAYRALAALPHPLDRIIDNLTGSRDRRLMVEGRVHFEGLLTLTGARYVLVYLLLVIAICGVTLRRRRHR